MDSGQIWSIICNNPSPLFSDSFECAEHEKVVEKVSIVALTCILSFALFKGVGQILAWRRGKVAWRKKLSFQRMMIDFFWLANANPSRHCYRHRFASALITRILDHTDSLPDKNPFKRFIQAEEGAKLIIKAIKKFRVE